MNNPGNSKDCSFNSPMILRDFALDRRISNRDLQIDDTAGRNNCHLRPVSGSKCYSVNPIITRDCTVDRPISGCNCNSQGSLNHSCCPSCNISRTNAIDRPVADNIRTTDAPVTTSSCSRENIVTNAQCTICRPLNSRDCTMDNHTISDDCSVKSVTRKSECTGTINSPVPIMDLTLDPDAVAINAVCELLNCQQEIEAVNNWTYENMLKTIQKANNLKKPLYEGRSDAIQTIPHFWLRAFLNHSCIFDIIHEDEKNCLYFLTNVEVEEFEDIEAGFRIHFYFKSNPYLRNNVLTKAFYLKTSDEEPHSKSIKIQWKKGNNILYKIKQSRINGDQMESETTFFTWYEGSCNPSDDVIAQAIKHDLWPNVLQYCIGVEDPRDTEDLGVKL